MKIFNNIQNVLKKLHLSPKRIFKILAIGFIALLVLAIGIAVVGSALRVAGFDSEYREYDRFDERREYEHYGQYDDGYYKKQRFDDDFSDTMHKVEYAFNQLMEDGVSMFRGDMDDGIMMAKLAPQSLRMNSIEPIAEFDEVLGGANAEDFEKRNYSIEYETQNFEQVCTAIENLKPFEYVVFSNANVYDKNCNYSFKVESDWEESVVASLKALNPSMFNINIHTIERSIESNEGELKILERKLKSLSETLYDAEVAYDTALASLAEGKNYGSIAQIVNGKVAVVERLTREKLNTQAQIDRLTKRNEKNIEDIEYTHFSVSVIKTEMIDWKGIGYAWKYQFEDFIGSANKMVQGLTLGLILFILYITKVLVYLFVVIMVLRLVWVMVRRMFRWEPESLKKLFK